MNNIISTRLMGGLGNQLFQYATAYALSKEQGRELVLDTRFFDSYTLHGGYKLDRLNISSRKLTNEECSYFPLWQIRLLTRFPKLDCFFRNWLLEKSFNFQILSTKQDKSVNLVGYWQSPKYFAKYRELLKIEFSPKSSLNKHYQNHTSNIMENDSVAIHIRRGDYLSNPNALAKHGVCTTGYYKAAIELIKKKYKEPKFFFFSDDIAWTKLEFADLLQNYHCTYVSGGTAEDDFWLMSKAKNHIIANSTFSWWAAWLADHEENNIVICPDPWFDDQYINTDDLLPGSWIKLNKYHGS